MTTRNPKNSTAALTQAISLRVSTRLHAELITRKPAGLTMGEYVRSLVLDGLVAAGRKEADRCPTD